MTVPPTSYLHELGPQAQAMSRNCGNDRMAMILQYVAIGSMIVMAGVAVSQAWKDAFGHDRGQGRSRCRCHHVAGPGAGNHIGMVPDYGPQTAGLATTHLIPTRPRQHP